MHLSTLSLLLLPLALASPATEATPALALAKRYEQPVWRDPPMFRKVYWKEERNDEKAIGPAWDYLGQFDENMKFWVFQPSTGEYVPMSSTYDGNTDEGLAKVESIGLRWACGAAFIPEKVQECMDGGYWKEILDVFMKKE